MTIKAFYNLCLWAGVIGTIVLAIILWIYTPWWVFGIGVLSLVAIEFGCFSYKEKEFMKREDDREIIQDLVRKARIGPRQVRDN